MNEFNAVELRALVAAECFAAAVAGKETNRIKSSIGQQVTALYKAIPKGDKKAFDAEFGNGLAAKEKGYDCGLLQKTIQETASAKAAEWLASHVKSIKIKDKVARALIIKEYETAAKGLAQVASRQLSARRSECRAAFAASLEVKEGFTVQQALTAAKSAKKGAQHENKKSSKVSIDPKASMEDISNALSLWVASHKGSAEKLAAKLADFMPIEVSKAA